MGLPSGGCAATSVVVARGIALVGTRIDVEEAGGATPTGAAAVRYDPAVVGGGGQRNLGGWITTRVRRAEAAVLHPDGFDPAQSILLRARVPITLLLRVSGRAYAALFDRRAGRRAAPGLGWLLADVVEAVVLVRRPASGFIGVRLTRDTAETVWFAATRTNYTPVSVSGAPLMLEASFRYGPFAALLAIPHLAAAAFARRSTRRSLDLSGLVYLPVSWAGASAVWRLERSRVAEHHRMRAALVAAYATQAADAGRRAVVLHRLDVSSDSPGDTPHDLVGNARPALDLSDLDPASALAQVMQNRRRTLWAGEAVFLTQMLDRWAFESRRRAFRAVDQVATIEVHGEVTPVVLTPTQEADLTAQLDRLPLRGPVTVTVRSWDSFGGALEVVVAGGGTVGVRLRSAHDPAVPRPALADHSPSAAWMGAVWAAANATPAGDAAPIRAVLPGICSFAALGLAAQRLVERQGRSSHWGIHLGAIAAATVQCAGVRLGSASPVRVDGTPRGSNVVMAPALLSGFFAFEHSKTRQLIAITAQAAVIAANLWTQPAPRAVRAAVLDVAFGPVIGGALSAIYRSNAERDLRRELSIRDEAFDEAVRRAAERGEREEWELLTRAIGQARGRLRPELHPEVAARWERSFALVEHAAASRLAALRQGSGEQRSGLDSDHRAQCRERGADGAEVRLV